MRIYLEDDIIFYKYKTGIETTYWLEVELFEHAENNIDMLYDFVARRWYDKSVIEKTIHCLMEARPNKDWSKMKELMLSKLQGGWI